MVTYNSPMDGFSDGLGLGRWALGASDVAGAKPNAWSRSMECGLNVAFLEIESSSCFQYGSNGDTSYIHNQPL